LEEASALALKDNYEKKKHKQHYYVKNMAS